MVQKRMGFSPSPAGISKRAREGLGIGFREKRIERYGFPAYSHRRALSTCVTHEKKLYKGKDGGN